MFFMLRTDGVVLSHELYTSILLYSTDIKKKEENRKNKQRLQEPASRICP